MDSRAAIERALEELRKVVEATVRAEQLKDQLTELPNDVALAEWLENAIQNKIRFWIAFFEVDHFKRKNDEFGYEIADSLLGASGFLMGSLD